MSFSPLWQLTALVQIPDLRGNVEAGSERGRGEKEGNKRTERHGRK